MYLFHCSAKHLDSKWRSTKGLAGRRQQRDMLQEKSIWKRCFGFEWARFSTALYCSAPKAEKHCLGFKRACSCSCCTLHSLLTIYCPLYIAPSCTAHIKPRLQMFCCTSCNPHSADFNRSPESKIIARFANVALFHRCDLICEAPPSLGLLRFPAICAAPALLPCCWWIKRAGGAVEQGGAVMLLLRRPHSQPFDKKDYSLYIFGPCDQWDIRVAHWKNFKKWPARSL